LLQIELEFVFVGDVNAKLFDANLFVIETFSKGGEVNIAILFGPLLGLDKLLGMHIVWAVCSNVPGFEWVAHFCRQCGGAKVVSTHSHPGRRAY
jgi:hypothetical protein